MVPHPRDQLESGRRVGGAVREHGARQYPLWPGGVHHKRAARGAGQHARLPVVRGWLRRPRHGRCLPAGRNLLPRQGQPACRLVAELRGRLRELRPARAERRQRSAYRRGGVLLVGSRRHPDDRRVQLWQAQLLCGQEGSAARQGCPLPRRRLLRQPGCDLRARVPGAALVLGPLLLAERRAAVRRARRTVPRRPPGLGGQRDGPERPQPRRFCVRRRQPRLPRRPVRGHRRRRSVRQRRDPRLGRAPDELQAHLGRAEPAAADAPPLPAPAVKCSMSICSLLLGCCCCCLRMFSHFGTRGVPAHWRHPTSGPAGHTASFNTFVHY
mmetsp:Transcript_12188/g.38854  ORF Transcript_12188/g.38854 Transcript_12188/m.38854 type:complete len:326 (+) Transcript_12188:742-1719(+)